jgi:hypothetical protein
MGHIVEKNLRELCTKKIVCGIDDLKDFFEFCKACMLKKRRGFSFP